MRSVFDGKDFDRNFTNVEPTPRGRHVVNMSENWFCSTVFDETVFPDCFGVAFCGKKNLANFDHFFDHICYQNHWNLPYGRYRGILFLMDTEMPSISTSHVPTK